MASHLLEKMAQDGTNSLRERVYRHLEAALREGQLHHGTCLDQDRLCEELGVSRTPLRDALLRLEAEGFVTIQPRKGVYITPVSDAFVKSACQILGALEADCLDTVFPLLTSRHIRQLEESNKRQEQFLERRQAVEYHAEIILNVVIKVKYFIETASEKSMRVRKQYLRCVFASAIMIS